MTTDSKPDTLITPTAASGYRPSATMPVGSDCGLVDPWLEINSHHLAWNLAQVRARVGERPIMAVLKGNAYGHGTVGVAQALARQGVDQFAVVKVGEALALRAAGLSGPILNFGPFSAAEAAQLVAHEIDQSVFVLESVERLGQAAEALSKPARVQIKVDTGLSRVGVPYDQALPFIEDVAARPGLEIKGIFTTLTEEDDFDPIQLARLQQVCRAAEAKGIALGLKHAASSSAVATLPAAGLDLVRPGNCLYGFEPLPPLQLKPVMALKCRVIQTKTLWPGDTIAYHRRGRVEQETRLATLPLGYADGYPPQAVDQAQVLIRGRRWPLVVYMSANHATVDISGGDDIEVGDEVVLFGGQGDQTITLSEVAAWAGSSVYQVATAMSPFLPRIYLT